MDNKNEPILSLEYQLTIEEYLNFNHASANAEFKKKKRKTMIMGSIYLISAIVLFFLVIGTDNVFRDALLLVVVFLFCFGSYSLSFYPFFFPRALTKSATKNFLKSEYLQNLIHLDFYADKLIEKSLEIENSFFWGEIKCFKETKLLYMIVLENNRCILISKKAQGEKIYELEEFLKLMEDKYKIEHILLEEK